MPNLPRGIKIYRKLRYRKGYGVHSPFVFNLITKVIEEKSPYYIYDDINKIKIDFLSDRTIVRSFSSKGKKKKSTIAKVTKSEIQHHKYGALLFRLVNYFKFKNILHFGAKTGIMSVYLTASQKDSKCIALESRKELVEVASEKLNSLKDKIQFQTGDYKHLLEKIRTYNSTFDLIFIDLSHSPELAGELAFSCLNATHEHSVMIIDGIKRNTKMISLWKKLKNDPRTGISIDLHALGLIFFNKNIYKQHYKTYFDYGEKQNIYKNGRQRLNILSWRKKNKQK